MNLNVPVVGILRGIDPGFFTELMPAAFQAGLQAIEVTCNTPLADRIISQNRPKVPQGKYLGMGTVRNLVEARQAIDAGAMFLISPNLDLEVIRYAKKMSVPMIAGALSPTEIYQAWSAGAWMVKVFPIRFYGPRYLTEIAGPFEQIPLMAVGGVDLDNVASYFKAGARAVGVSSSLFGREAIDRKNIDELSINIKTFLNTVSKATNK